MTTQQPDPLRVAAELDCHNANLDRQAAKAIRTQHKQIAAYKLLVESQEVQLSQHRAQADKCREAIATLQSERDANATLTAEIERLNSCLKWEQNRAERIGTHQPGCETWGPRHYECALRAIERKDALLRQALEAVAHGCPPDCKDGLTDSGGTYPWGEAVLMRCPTCETFEAITKELSQ